MIVDLHCHYTLSARRADAAMQRFSFEPAQDGAAAAWDSCVSPRAAGSIVWRGLRALIGLSPWEPIGPQLDERLAEIYQRHLFAPGPIERYVLLAFDWYHDDAGHRPGLPERDDQFGSDIYTSNSLVRALCRAHPERFLFGASVHPYRKDAPELVREVFAAGASLLKWIPLHQNIDIADPRTVAVLRTCAALELPLLVHYGEEFTLATQHPEHRPLSALLHVLSRLPRRERPKVIVAHLATPVSALGAWEHTDALVAVLRDGALDGRLYADISALTTLGKFPYVAKFAREQDLHPRLLFGSDFPVPVCVPLLRSVVGGAAADIARERSWPQKACRIFQQAGYNQIVFEQAPDVLPNVNFFQG